MNKPRLPPAPQLRGLLETALYVDDLSAARDFYERVLGLEAMHGDDRLVAYAIAPAQVLLLFQRGGTDQVVELRGGRIPGHDGSGRTHFAFAIASDALSAWEARLQALDVEVEGRMEWPQGGHSVYFRDPDGHLVELATPGLWPNY
ncbi:MAG TPA: VOC family protein [Stenotrophomonas sp.]